MSRYLFVFADVADAANMEYHGCDYAVKAQLCVRHHDNWLNLYSDNHASYDSRIRNLEILGQFASELSSVGYFAMFKAADVSYGRYLFSNLWSATERYLRFWTLLESFFRSYPADEVVCDSLSEAHPIDARCFRTFCAEKKIKWQETDRALSAVPLYNGDDIWKGATGAYPAQGIIGSECFIYRFDRAQAFNPYGYPFDISSGGIKFEPSRSGASCHFARDGSNGLLVSWRFRHIHIPSSTMHVSLVAGGHMVSIKACRDGWKSNGQHSEKLAEIGPMYPGVSLAIKDGRGWFMADGMPLCPLETTTTSKVDGLYFEQHGSGECYVYLDRMILLGDISDDGIKILHNAPQDFLKHTMTYPNGSEDIARRNNKNRIRCAALFHPGWYVEPAINGDTPGLCALYQDGWKQLLAERGIDVTWISAQESWFLDGGRLQSNTEEYLYDPIETNISELNAEWKSGFERDYEVVANLRHRLTAIAGNPDFADLFLEQMKSSLSAALSIAGDRLRAERCLKKISPDIFIGARLDGSFPWATAAAKGRNIPTMSAEISFIYHEIHRLHRLAGVSENTDVICLWGNEHARKLDDFKVSSSNIKVAGLLALDLFRKCPSPYKLSASDKDMLAKFLGLSLKPGPCVLYGGYYGGIKSLYDIDEFRSAISAILASLDKHNGGNIIIKSMIGDDPVAMRNALDGLDQTGIHILEPRQPFHNAFYFAIADVVTALPTTLLAEAAVQGCQVVCIWGGTHGSWYPVSGRHIELLEKIFPVSRSAKELQEIIAEKLSCNSGMQIKDEYFQELFGYFNSDNATGFSGILSQLAGVNKNAGGYLHKLWTRLAG